MSYLPRYHVPRSRLVSLLGQAPVAVVEAGGGYGKSVLAGEYQASLGVAAAVAALDPRDADPASLVARLRRGLVQSGLSDLAAAFERSHTVPEDAIDSLLEALAEQGEPVLLVVDDADHAESRRAAGLLVRAARGLADPHRLIVLARRLPEGAEELRTLAQTVLLGTVDLAFTGSEVGELYERRFDAALAPHEAEALARTTAGWAAAFVLAAPRVAKAPEPLAVLDAMGGLSGVLGHLVRQELATLDGDARDALVEVAHLPLISPEVMASATGIPDLFGRVVRTGLSLASTPEGRWELPGPVQEFLTGLGPLSRKVASRAAQAYLEQGEVEAAIQVELSAGDPVAAAALLAGLAPARVEQLDFIALQGFVDALPPAAVEAHPRVLLHLARACEPAAQGQRRTAALERALSALEDGRDPALSREVEAEVARDLIRDGHADQAEEVAQRLLDEAGPEELQTRVRTLHVLGRVNAWRADQASLAAAEPLLEEAAQLYLRLGEKAWSAQALLSLGYHVHYLQGAHERGVARLDDALSLLSGRNRLRAVVLTFRAEVLIDWGRYGEAEASLREARELGELLGDARVLAYAAWLEGAAASQRGDAARTVERVRQAEHHRGDWFEHYTGVLFLAQAAEMLDRVGETALAWQYLSRAKDRESEAETDVQLAEGALLARSGDPARAEQVFAQLLAHPRLETHEPWRITLLRAYAALRRGDPDAGALGARAFDEAASWTEPTILLVRERAIAERLLALAVEAGSRAAVDLRGLDLPWAVSVLGRFEVTRGRLPVRIPPGKPMQLLKLLACAGGRVLSDAAIEALWPETEPSAGRKGLRNVLDRLHRGAGDLVAREGETLSLMPGTEVDATAFEAEAGRAIALGRDSAALARSAVARYRGELLPDDMYEDWAAAPRERLRLRYLELLDVLVAEAAAHKDLDEALRLLERSIEADRYDEERYLRAARLLLEQGRRLRAATMLKRGAAVLEEVGLPLPAGFRELERAIFAVAP